MPRKAAPLTDSAIKTAKPKTAPYKLSDGEGMYLEITTNGSKLWRMKYRFDGKEKRLSFGAYPAVSLAQARQQRKEARQLLADGQDPGEHRKAAKREQRHTFEELAREWHRYNAKRWAPATADKAMSYLENDLFPIIGRKPVATITRPELVELVRRIEKRGALNAAKKVRQWLSQVFRYALAKGAVEANPATDLNVLAEHAPRVEHHPHIPLAELPELLKRLDATRASVMTRHAVRLLLLTGVRPGELRNAPWAEFDIEAAVWTIPAERMKARRPHIVPLPRQAVAILRQLQEITGSHALVFPGRNPARPMSENTVNKALAGAGYEGRQTGHGFRHLLSTELNGRGFNRDWIKRQLAHGDKDEIRDTYNHATYLEQRRGMMQTWADSLDALCAGANVVAIKRKA